MEEIRKKDMVSYRHISYILGDVFSTHVDVNTTSKMSVHFHNGTELILITRGNYQFYAPDLVYEGSGPCLGIFQMGAYHGCLFTECETLTANRYVINYTDRLLKGIPECMLDIDDLINNSSVIIPLDDTSFKRLQFLFEEIHLCYSGQSNRARAGGISTQMYGYFTVLLNVIADLYRSKAAIVNVDRTSNYVYAVIREILYAAEQNTPVSSMVLADKFSIGHSKLADDFRRVTGMSIKEMYDMLRLDTIKKLIISGTSNKDLVSKYDFSSESYFVQFFKKHTGVTPGEYRKLHDKK